MKKTLIFFVVLVMMFWSVCAWAELKDGLWEITSQVEMKGMQQKMPPATVRQCITKSNPVPKNQDKTFECKSIDQKVSGNTISYSMECKGKDGVMQTSGKHTYTGNTMEGSATTNFKMKGQPEMQMASKIKGKYIGPCPK